MLVIIAFVAVVIAYYFMQKEKIRREEKRQRFRDKQEELLSRLRSGNKTKQNGENL